MDPAPEPAIRTRSKTLIVHGAAISVMAIVCAIGYLTRGYGRSYPKREVVEFSWNYFSSGALLCGAMVLGLIGMCATAIGARTGSTREQATGSRLYSVVARLALIMIAVIQGPYLLAVWLHKSTAWFESLQVGFFWSLLLVTAVVVFGHMWLDYRKRKAEAAAP